MELMETGMRHLGDCLDVLVNDAGDPDMAWLCHHGTPPRPDLTQAPQTMYYRTSAEFVGMLYFDAMQ